ncbi:hypothetical protein AQUCO_00900394v1 [Aquilegia coerulea]|uniref:Thioredoxin domain-containing protein n=1 Tax=Aquilegia coerulea TaxID=218851 RepID=A0A2G5EDI7_AQUCA|nr:hypothetical protein AQUCO_00900394v1 [Aquilegia coerulea]
MSLLQATALSAISSSTLFAFQTPPQSFIRTSSSSFKTLKPLSQPIPAKTPRRKLLCKPLSAKYIREDYLVKKVSAKEVEELVKGERSVPIIVDFYATWCGPCILMAQELEMLAVEYESNALFVKVDTDNEYEFARDMQVRGLPTLYFISPDPTKDAIRTEGLIPIQMMRDIINEL